jgi:quercetin dioxygenase-like cupin family protein
MSSNTDSSAPAHSACPLRDTTTFITTHDPTTAKAVYYADQPASWERVMCGSNYFNISYTTGDFPVDMNDEVDIRKHQEILAGGRLGLVNPKGTVCRTVDFAPGGPSLMHRTQSLDYGIVVAGTVEHTLDSGEVRTMGPGDVMVQRATMHAWRNASDTEWARIVFVLQDSRPVVVGQQRLKEDLGHAVGVLPASGNDQ